MHFFSECTLADLSVLQVPRSSWICNITWRRPFNTTMTSLHDHVCDFNVTNVNKMRELQWLQGCNWGEYRILAHRIRISDILSWDRKSYVIHVILPGHVRAVHWFYWNSCDIVVKWRHCYVKVTSSYHVATQRIRHLLGAFCLNIEYGIYGEHEKESIIHVRMG